MKKGLRFVLVFAAVGLCFSSCKKNYHCQCTYKNEIKLVRDLGLQTTDDATSTCDSYDSTVTGERWTCTIY